MANQTRRIKPEVLDADEAAFAALQTIVDYRPANPAYRADAVAAARAELAAARTAEAQAAAAAAAARDEAVSKEWNFHNLMLGVKDQVTAQFGRDSNEVQSLGLKKASEYRPRTRRTQAEAGEQ